MQSEAAKRADFSEIRYGQCWEDADILLEGLAIDPGDVCISIASAGDNTLAMAGRGAKRIIAIDISPAQLACLELRIAAYRALSHDELLRLIGSIAAPDRVALYKKCRPGLSASARSFWDDRGFVIAAGAGGAGKFERYFAIFRGRALPLIHDRKTIAELMQRRNREERERFYEVVWDNWRWRALFRVFFSRAVMGRLGRDPEFFRYVTGSVSAPILARTRHALVELDPLDNPYLQWILTGRHVSALPYALRAENFEPIRDNLDAIELHCCPLERILEELEPGSVDRFNLSDIFEYMSECNYMALLDLMVRAARPGARLAYWNMLADRHRPDSLRASLQPLAAEAKALHLRDKAFFYSAFVLEEVAASAHPPAI